MTHTELARGDDKARPRLAYLHGPGSPPVLDIVGAARRVCEVVWVVDAHEGVSAVERENLRQLGTVIDSAQTDIDGLADALREVGVGGVLTLTDGYLALAAELARLLGLTGIRPGVAEALTDKFAQRLALRNAGLDGPDFWAVSPHSSRLLWRQISDADPFPAVLKPRRSTSSRLTTVVGSVADAQAFIRENPLPGPLDAKSWLLETFIADPPTATTGEGFADYVSVESFAADGLLTHLAVTGRPPLAPPFRETGSIIPSTLGAADQRRAVACADKAVKALRFTTGFLHTEIKFSPTGPQVIEVNGRIGGGGIGRMIGDALGINLTREAMRNALGMRVSLPALPHFSDVNYFLALQPQRVTSAVISRIDGVDAIRGLEGVASVVENWTPDKTIDWRHGSQDYAVAVQGHTADHGELRDVMRRIQSLVTIRLADPHHAA